MLMRQGLTMVLTAGLAGGCGGGTARGPLPGVIRNYQATALALHALDTEAERAILVRIQNTGSDRLSLLLERTDLSEAPWLEGYVVARQLDHAICGVHPRPTACPSPAPAATTCPGSGVIILEPGQSVERVQFVSRTPACEGGPIIFVDVQVTGRRGDIQCGPSECILSFVPVEQ
jgi:hypothetical protein